MTNSEGKERQNEREGGGARDTLRGYAWLSSSNRGVASSPPACPLLRSPRSPPSAAEWNIRKDSSSNSSTDRSFQAKPPQLAMGFLSSHWLVMSFCRFHWVVLGRLISLSRRYWAANLCVSYREDDWHQKVHCRWYKQWLITAMKMSFYWKFRRQTDQM